MNRKSTQEQINNDKTCIDESDDEREVNKDVSKPTVHNSEKLTSTNNSSEKLNEENTTTLMNKLAAININDNNNESENLHKIKKGRIIDFTIDNMPYKVEILSRAAKATGKFKNSFNIEYKEPISMCNQQGHVNFDKVTDIVMNNVNTEEVIIIDYIIIDYMIIDDNCFEKAKLNELNNWKTKNVYEEIPYNNQKLIHVKWVYTMKETNNQQIPKARLVVKGFEEPAKDEILKDSPTCSKENLLVVLSVIAQGKWKLNSIDIKATFLQGENIDSLYVLRPKEANTDKIWLLKKVYIQTC